MVTRNGGRAVPPNVGMTFAIRGAMAPGLVGIPTGLNLAVQPIQTGPVLTGIPTSPATGPIDLIASPEIPTTGRIQTVPVSAAMATGVRTTVGRAVMVTGRVLRVLNAVPAAALMLTATIVFHLINLASPTTGAIAAMAIPAGVEMTVTVVLNGTPSVHQRHPVSIGMSVGRTRTVGTISPVSPAIGNALGLIPTVRAAMSVVPGNGHVLTGMTGPAMANPPDRRVSTVTTDRVTTDRVTTDRVMGNRSNDSRREDAPRFSRGQGRGDRPEKPAFKRVGGFSRDADERNKARSADDENRGRRNDRSDRDEDSRFTGQQRKESGDRRTGMYTKAPNYNLEDTRARESYANKRTDGPRGSRKDGDEKPKRSSSGEQQDGPNTTRLNRYIANSGVCSRREADELIAQGDISVNGKVVTEMGYKVKDGDTVKYGTKVLNPEKFVYVLLNKPKDYITTTEDPDERKTVMELVADAGNFRMYPIGRLDRNTTGLLLFTNDGELADKLTHPSNNVRKIYQVELDKPITDEHFEALKKGIELEDGPIKPDALSIVTPDAYVIGIEIHSGRNRIVRRMFEHFGYEVSKLDRTTYAGLTKKELPRGKWRFLDPKEVVKLKYLS